MRIERQAIAFACEGEWLYGVLDLPLAPVTRGVLVVVGGPQYRAGSHRQFTQLARSLAGEGVAVMRFDLRGMGDSEGDIRHFSDVNNDIHAAITTFLARVHGIEELLLCGLCDGAAAAALYAPRDSRVTGVIMLNPWLRTDTGAALATLKHYYPARLLAPDFWHKILTRRFIYAAAAGSFRQLVAHVAARPVKGELPERMRDSLYRFTGKVLIILGAADLTAQEFASTASQPAWKTLMRAQRVKVHTIAQADHTFSRPDWHEQVTALTVQFAAGK